MSDKIILAVEERTVIGKKVKQLRKQGLVPAIMYGQDETALPIAAQATAAVKAWRSAGKHQPIEVKIGRKKRLAMIKAADIDPVKHSLRHMSLHVIRQNEKVTTEVPIRVADEGQIPAERAGLVVLQAVEKVTVEALPADLPEFLEIPSVALVEPGDHVTVASITPVDGVDIQTEPEIVVASVYEPSALAAANDAAGGDAIEEETQADTEADEETAGTESEGEGTPEAAKPKE